MDRIVNFGAFDNLVGILSEGDKEGSASENPAVIILNAGMIHRPGPNRIYWKLARKLSGQGFDVLRFDFSGIGDSEYRQDNLPGAESASQEVVLAMDYLGRARNRSAFVLVGHCSGVAPSISVSLADSRTVGLVLINAPTPDSQEGEQLKSQAYYWRKAIFSPQSWTRLFKGKSDYWRILKATWGRIKNALFPGAKFDPEEEKRINFLKIAFQNIDRRKIRVLFIGSGPETGIEYYKRCIGKEMGMLSDNSLLDIRHIPGSDHTFTPLQSQMELFDSIQKWIITFECKT